MVTQREATLGMFHAAGKVVYNKREDLKVADPNAEPPPKPADHLLPLHKTKVSQVNIDELMNETGTDIPTFVATLHENYLLSCSGSDFVETFDTCIDYLSDSDILSPEGTQRTNVGSGSIGAGRAISQAGGIDMLRQNEITFQVAVRGLLFALPFPVNRGAHPGGRKGDSYKMFYPASLRLWKPTEETDSLLSLVMDQMSVLNGPVGTSHRGSNGTTSGEGVASWKQRNTSFEGQREDESLNPSAPPRTLTSRPDMLFDTLPYLARIRSRHESDMRNVKRITQFHGTNLQADDNDNDDELDTAEVENTIDLLSAADETTDRAAAASPQKKQQRFAMLLSEKRNNGPSELMLMPESNEAMQQLDKLYISDDDIQDD